MSLVLARADADVVGITVGVAVAQSEAVCEAGKALGHAINVASDTLLQAWHFNFAATDGNVAGGGVVEMNLVRAVSKFVWFLVERGSYLFDALGVARDAIDLARFVSGAGDVLGADIPGVDLSLNGEDEGEENGNSSELHVD